MATNGVVTVDRTSNSQPTETTRRGRHTDALAGALSTADAARSQADAIHKLLFGHSAQEDDSKTSRAEEKELGWLDILDVGTDRLRQTLEQTERALSHIREALEA